MRQHEWPGVFLHIYARVQQPSWPLNSWRSVLHVAPLRSSGVLAMGSSQVTLMTLSPSLWDSNLPTIINTGGSAEGLPPQPPAAPSGSQQTGDALPNPRGERIKGNQSAFSLDVAGFFYQTWSHQVFFPISSFSFSFLRNTSTFNVHKRCLWKNKRLLDGKKVDEPKNPLKKRIWTFVCAVAVGSYKLLDISVIYAEYSVF